MPWFNVFGWINAAGFLWGLIKIVKLTFLYERPTYFDGYFYLKFSLCIFGIITQVYTAYYTESRPDWFIKWFACFSWIAVIIFCRVMEKLSTKINIKRPKKGTEPNFLHRAAPLNIETNDKRN